MLLKEQNYGVEIELVSITRQRASGIIARHFGTTNWHAAREYGYDAWAAKDRKGRVWKCVKDASLNDRNGGCEVVTPILQYEDMEDLQAIVRLLREAGAKADGSCGIHVHVDASKHTIDSLQRLMNFAIGRQDLFYEALGVSERRTERFCRKMNKNLFKAIQQDSERTTASLERLWYSPVNDGYRYGISHDHYNSTRYHGINLHAFFTKGTVEFRLFNGTTHAGYRAHRFVPVWGERQDNCIRFIPVREDELPFEKNYYFRPEEDGSGSVHADENIISWFVQSEEQKEIEKRGLPDWLRLNEEDILLLK